MRSRKRCDLAMMSENPYQAPSDGETPPRAAFRSRGHAAATGAVNGLCLTAKWTSIIAGPLYALLLLALAGLVFYRWWSGGADADGFMLMALNLMILFAWGILQLFIWILAFSLIGAVVQAVREAIGFKAENNSN
jgi:hypothetical protein